MGHEDQVSRKRREGNVEFARSIRAKSTIPPFRQVQHGGSSGSTGLTEPMPAPPRPQADPLTAKYIKKHEQNARKPVVIPAGGLLKRLEMTCKPTKGSGHMVDHGFFFEIHSLESRFGI